jgi:hypothetical protein
MNAVWKACAAVLLLAAAGADAAGRIAYEDRHDPAMSQRRAAEIDVREAARRLARAQIVRRLGIAPLAGEARFPYWQRQEKLRELVEAAQRRYNETRQAQLARR